MAVPIYLESMYPVDKTDIIELTPIPDVIEFTNDPTHILYDIEAAKNSGLILHNRTDRMYILDYGEIVATGSFRDKKEVHWIVSDAAVVSAATQMGAVTEQKLNCVRELEQEVRARILAMRDGTTNEPEPNQVYSLAVQCAMKRAQDAHDEEAVEWLERCRKSKWGSYNFV